jgi:hypothetical protein
VVKRLVCAFVTALAAAGPALAKEGAQAHLLQPLPATARPGSFVTVRWSVTVRDESGTRVGLSAIGMLVRLVGRGGASTTVVARENVGPPYSARVRVPAGGIRGVRFGVSGSNGIFFFPLK